MRSVTNVAWLAGPLVALGYLVGSLPVAYLLGRRRLHRQLGRPAELDDVRRADDDADPPLGQPGELTVALIQAGFTLAMATGAWHVITRVAPPATPSSIAVLSAQAITVWQSVALWVGLAVVVGTIAPATNGFRGGTGVVPAMALLLAYAPLVFSGAVAGFFIGMVVWRDIRRAPLLAFPTAVVFEWLAWVYDWRQGWGFVHGPELSLFVTITAALLFTAHRLRVEPGTSTSDGADPQ